MSEKAGAFVGLLAIRVGVFVGLFSLLTGGICRFIANDSVYILTIIVKFPTIIVVKSRVAKKSVDKSKKLKIGRTEMSEKTKNKKDRAFTKKGTRPATIFLVSKLFLSTLPPWPMPFSKLVPNSI